MPTDDYYSQPGIGAESETPINEGHSLETHYRLKMREARIARDRETFTFYRDALNALIKKEGK